MFRLHLLQVQVYLKLFSSYFFYLLFDYYLRLLCLKLNLLYGKLRLFPPLLLHFYFLHHSLLLHHKIHSPLLFPHLSKCLYHPFSLYSLSPNTHLRSFLFFWQSLHKLNDLMPPVLYPFCRLHCMQGGTLVWRSQPLFFFYLPEI